jgi:Protein of unknown function (DUF1588)/Protein of unknown function (DUF1592)/Protein of unknown function (DUF1595)/Protein of unknown function (DUF1585)/Protein of unknown function (DUF1587)
MRAVLVSAVLVFCACAGDIVGGSRGPAGEQPTTTPPCMPTGQVAVTPMLRLTRAQVDNHVRDVLGAMTVPSASLSEDERLGPFAVNAQTATTRGLAEQYQFVAEAVGTEVEANVQAFAPCTGLPAGGEACAAAWLDSVAPRLLRRPLDADAKTRWLTLYRAEASAGGSYATGMRAVVEGLLQSPSFLYRAEPLPSGRSPDTTEAWALDDYAKATRLSFLLWNAGPDAALLAQAAKGLDADALRTQAARLLADSRAKRMTGAFAEAWLGLGALSNVNAARLQGLDAAIVPQMKQESTEFLDRVLRATPGHTMEALFTSSRSSAGSTLASTIYADTSAPDAMGLRTLTGRAGVLTQASLMFVRAHSEQTSPVLRGRWVREVALCLPIAEPPPNVVAVPLPPVPGQTTRQRVDAHRTDPSCSGCHASLDGVGFGFEAFDQFGRHRDTDQGQPVDDSGQLLGTDVDGPFRGALELGQKLSTSAAASQCFARQYFRFGLGHPDAQHETCTVQSMAKALGADGAGFAQAIDVLLGSDAFSQRRSP